MPGLVKINYYSCVMSAGARQITPIVGVGSRPHALLICVCFTLMMLPVSGACRFLPNFFIENQ